MHTIYELLWVGAGGFLGAALRYAVWLGCVACFSKGHLWATLAVNAAGSLTMGFCLPFLNAPQHPARLFLLVGVLGGFTTFSSFSADTLALYHQQQYGWVTLNVAANVAVCLAAVWGGFELARLLKA